PPTGSSSCWSARPCGSAGGRPPGGPPRGGAPAARPTPPGGRGGRAQTRPPTGAVAAVGSHDAERVGAAMDIVARLAGAAASFVVVAALMLRTSTTLGLLVVVGVPLLSAGVAARVRPLRRRRARHRELVGDLTTVGADTVS